MHKRRFPPQGMEVERGEAARRRSQGSVVGEKEKTEEVSEKCCLNNTGVYMLVGRIKWREEG